MDEVVELKILLNHQNPVSQFSYSLLKNYLSTIKGVNIKPNNWPMGFGSLEHDNLPLLYQPSAILEVEDFVDGFLVFLFDVVYKSSIALLL